MKTSVQLMLINIGFLHSHHSLLILNPGVYEANNIILPLESIPLLICVGFRQRSLMLLVLAKYLR